MTLGQKELKHQDWFENNNEENVCLLKQKQGAFTIGFRKRPRLPGTIVSIKQAPQEQSPDCAEKDEGYVVATQGCRAAAILRRAQL